MGKLLNLFIPSLGKTLLHTSGSGIVCDPRDPAGERGPAPIYDEDTLPEPAPEKKERVAIGKLVLDAGLKRGIRSAIFCPSLIYGHGAVPGKQDAMVCLCTCCDTFRTCLAFRTVRLLDGKKLLPSTGCIR